MTPNAFQPMDLGDIFANAWALMKRTFSSSVLLSIIIIMLSFIIFGYGMQKYLTVMVDLSASGMLASQDDPEIARQLMPKMMGGLVSVGFGSMIYTLALLFVQVLVTIASWEAMNGRIPGMGELLRRTLSRPFWITLLQTIILGVVLAAIFFVLVIMAFIITGGNKELLAPLILLALIPFIYPVIATMFRVHQTTIEERGPWQGMIASIALVKGSWWRTFGILFLVWLAVGAISILLSVAVNGGSLPAFNAGMSPDADQATQTAALTKQLASYSWPSIIVNAISGSILFTFFFYILTPMYADLRARRGDFLEYDDEEDGDPNADNPDTTLLTP